MKKGSTAGLPHGGKHGPHVLTWRRRKRQHANVGSPPSKPSRAPRYWIKMVDGRVWGTGMPHKLVVVVSPRPIL